MILRAENVVLPAVAANISRPAGSVIQSGVSMTMRPLRWMIGRVGSFRSRHHSTSVTSPKVQHIAMPAPLSISAAGCARIGTLTLNSGEYTDWPKYCL